MNNQPTIKITNATTGQPNQATRSNEKSKNLQNKKKKFYITNKEVKECNQRYLSDGKLNGLYFILLFGVSSEYIILPTLMTSHFTRSRSD
jgi:hypothetical protein